VTYQVQYLHNETRKWMSVTGPGYKSKAEALVTKQTMEYRYKSLQYRVKSV
jgi:hypothetical protein